MAAVIWRGSSGDWSNALSWQSLQVPGSADTAVFQAGDTSTATLDAPGAVGTVFLGLGTQATALIESTLAVAGSVDVLGGTLDLAPGGTIEGGTVDVGGGTVLAAGGVADNVVWLGALGGGLAITAATAADTQSATGAPLALAGTLALEGGLYDTAFLAQMYAGSSDALQVGAGQTVTLGSAASIVASADDPAGGAGVFPMVASLTLGGAGSLVNDGTITSDLSLAPLVFSAPSVVNAGTVALATATVPDVQRVFMVRSGFIEVPVTLTFDEILVPALVLSGASFANSGLISGAAATIDVTGNSFTNSGTIALGSTSAQMPVQAGNTAYLGTVMLASTLEIAAATSFDNTGIIAATSLDFADNLTLAQLGSVSGDLLFTGTFDLGGGTLDVGRVDPGNSVIFDGTVLNGTLIVDGGTLSTTGATLVGVTVLAQSPNVLLNVFSGAVLLNAATTELAYTTAATVSGVSVVAGAVGTPDLIGARAPGTLTFAASTSITDTVAGSTLEIGGQGTFAEQGGILMDGSSLLVETLDGTGTISLVGAASATLDTIVAGSGITVVFGSGNNLLVLPANASGVNALGLILDGLAPGDVIDFAAVSSNPPIGSPFGTGGAAAADGTLDVQGASGDQASVVLGSSAAGLTFGVSSDAQGGTIVTVACFRHGTRIATPRGGRAVERLRIGDLVLTGSGRAVPIKWLGRRAYGAALVARQRQLRPVRFAAGALGHGRPTRPLYLSPLHAVLLPGPHGPVLVPAAALVDGRRITRAPAEAVAYVHIELDTHDTVLAEGVAAETFIDHESRALFDNAADYAALYGAPAPVASPLPRVTEGWALQHVRGLLPGTARRGRGRGRPGAGALRGHIDRAANGVLEGWAMDDTAPGQPQELEVLLGPHPVGRIVANSYRIDLDHAGFASTLCGFTVNLPGLDPAIIADLSLRHPVSGDVLHR
jgi:hypothetical protein